MSQQAQFAAAMTTKYSASIDLWAQQKKAVTTGLCLEDTDQGVENKSEDMFGVVTMAPKNTRDTELGASELSTTRRWVFSQPYFNRLVLDSDDKVRLRVDPSSGMAEAQVAAAERQKDLIHIAACTGTAYTGKTFSTPVSLPGGGTLTEGNTGYTLAKYDAAVQYLRTYGMMEPADRIWCLWTSAEENTFKNVLQVSSNDYTMKRVRDEGVVASYGKVDFHELEDLYDETGALVHRMLPYSAGTGTGGANVRTVLMGVKKAVRRWTPGGVRGYVWFNGTKDQYEIVTRLDAGAARRMERGIVAIPCITTQ
jgi:hypothetical protein